MAQGWSGASLFVKIGVILTAVGFVVHLIGMASPYWFKYGDIHGGLWKICGAFCADVGTNANIPSWWEASRAFSILAVLAGAASLIIILLHLFVEQLDKKIFYIVALIAGFAACGCAMLAVIIYGSKTDYLHWAFGFTIVGALFHGAAAVLLTVAMVQKS